MNEVQVTQRHHVFNQVFVSRSFDETNHFEQECEDVMDLYRRVTGSELCFRGSKRHQSHNSDED